MVVGGNVILGVFYRRAVILALMSCAGVVKRIKLILPIIILIFWSNIGLAGTVAEPNLVSWWKFDEGQGSTAHDSAGNNNGAVHGATWTTGKIDGALSFDGNQDYVGVGDKTSLELQSFTLTFWSQNDNPTDSLQGGIAKGKIFGSANEFSYKLDFSNSKARASVSNTADMCFTITAPLTDTDWHMWTMTAADGVLAIYKDGVFVDDTNYTEPIDFNKNYEDFGIGAYTDGWYAFDGIIDDIRMYNRALDDVEIWQLYLLGQDYMASNPYPEDGAIHIDPDVVLVWIPGRDAVLHNVYFGIDFNDVNIATLDSNEYQGSFDQNSWDPCGLELSTTYYWRIDEVNGPNVWKGDVWSFETACPVIELSAVAFVFDANVGGVNPADQILTIWNSGGATLNWEIDYNCNWLDVEPTSGSSTGDVNIVTLSVDINGLVGSVHNCELIVTDPNAENSPAIVTVTLNLTEVWRNYIVFPDEPLTSESVFESDPEWVKFTIMLDDPCTVYFQNSKLYPFHYDFAVAWLEPFIGMSVPEYFDVTLYEPNQLAVLGAVIYPPMEGEPPSPEFLEYGIQFIRYDPYAREEIADMFAVVKDSVIADPGVEAFYFPSYEQLQVAEENQDWFESQGIPIGSIAQWIQGNICYSEGWALGKLKYFSGGQIQAAYLNGDLSAEDILLTDGVPAEIPFVAGIVSLSPSTPNSHMAILSRTYGIPFVCLARALDVEQAWQLVNRLTLLCVEEVGGICNVQLIDAVDTFTSGEIDDFLALKTPMPLEISPMVTYGGYSADTNNLLPEDINHFGGKASNYGILRTSIPDKSPVAVAFSFDLWNEFMDQPLTPSDSVIIDAGGYLLFWADNQSDQGPMHAGFKLSKSGESIGLFDIDGTTLINGLSFGSQTTDVSLGRIQDGGFIWAYFYGGGITPGTSNPGGSSGVEQGLFINEFMADNDTIVTDEYSEYDDWLELYNAGPAAVDLGGMYLTDDLDDPTNWMIPAGISGSTLREEIANRLSGYTYPVSDLAALSADLAAVRNIITNAGITSFSPELQDAIIAVLGDPNYGFDANRKVRFRSSTNVEDSERFTGAGLYNSYSGCLADDLDGDDAGPCLCDSNEANERGVFRAIRKVFASFYNDNAFLERLRRDVNEAEVGMALLVHHSFPDEFELANGVATMEKKQSPPHWDIKLNTQKGATPVTNPEQGALPEEVSVYADSDGSVAMTLIRQSNLVILGETVMDWQDDYNDLTALLVAAVEEFENVTGKTEYILDFEYKKVAPGGAAIPAGGIVVKQIREIPPLDAVSSTCPSISSCTCPGYDVFIERTYEDPAGGVSIETSYCLYGGPCFVCPLTAWCRTVIRGYTTKPVFLFSDTSQSYSAGHHNWCEDFLFTPHLEPGIDQCTLNQLRAQDIRVIHLGSMTECGTPYVETFGFSSEPFYLGDFEPDGDVDMVDFAMFAQVWLDSDCGQCGGFDLDCDEEVGLKDLKVFTENWLAD